MSIIEELIEPELLADPEAAPVLGCKPNTLRNSRHTGKLAGVDAPPHIKIGSSIRYYRADLIVWRSQFKKRTKTICANSSHKAQEKDHE